MQKAMGHPVIDHAASGDHRGYASTVVCMKYLNPSGLE